MSKSNATARRVRVERNIYRRPTGVFEIGFKDGAGVQRWRTVEGGITAARALRDELLAARGRGERVAPNPRLRFEEASERWLNEYVVDLREATRELYRNAVERHLRPRYATRRLDAIAPDDLARLVRELRAAGLSESSAQNVLGVVNRIYRYARRRLSWAGTNPVSDMLPSERPKPSQAVHRRVFEGKELEQVIAAARGVWRPFLILAAVTGARLSELCGLTWECVHIDDLDDAEIEFLWQVDRRGRRRPSKKDSSIRKLPIPRELALILAKHKLASRNTGPDAYVFATSTGRPLSQRNAGRALRATQRRAVDDGGRPTFPILHEHDEHDKPVSVPRGALPSMHSFRHTFASRAFLAGDSMDDVAFLLGHANANVTRTVYLHELNDARRRAMRRSKMVGEYGAAMEAAAAVTPTNSHPTSTEARQLREAS
ncbi:MAG TPA: tyrosine-type recombinase/integrase [Solirubrobacteraceae bacterium]|jgi:integrase|nr:tyrosine-type recombinase/integrase [Solirubrobacteraceae bacterium]